ncbi:Ohr family peroxiredoxin [Chitinophaga sp. Mgbs1]|uniref:Ohr family peroxiredoxin n=1 Tax=Chitinophaga solisilvae TaxID=1233460 RepID=A0A433WPY3_9BACT|nr:Ohr family peroxiredoxin [Chitinophaga solisilvae]
MQTTIVLEKVLYTARTRTTGGRDIALSTPGAHGAGTNPEQLFAAGWSACFISALGLAARKLQTVLPKDTYVDAAVDLGTTDGAYFLQARLDISLPGIDPELAQQLAALAHQTCPYSKAVSGNINISINIL